MVNKVKKYIISTGMVAFAVIVIAVSLLQPGMASADTTTLAPNAAGDRTALTASPAGSNYIRVQTNDGDTSYVYSSGSSYTSDLYNLANASLSGNITNVTVTIVARATNTPTQSSAYIIIKTGGTEYNNSASPFTVTTSYASYSYSWATNPAGGNWTWSQISSLQAGVALRRPRSGAQTRCTQLYVTVTYTPIVPPTVTTSAASPVGNTWAVLNGNITATGGNTSDLRGFQWGTSSGVYTANWTQSGSYGAGAFSQNITSFSQGTLYYYRALAHNCAGYGYGSELSFLTKPDAPSGLTATPGNQQISLAWTKGAGAQNTIIRGNIGSYPTSYTDGTSVYNGGGTSTTHAGLNNGDHWYYRAWSVTTNGTTQYSDSYVQADATPINTPAVTTGAASSITATAAVLSGNVTSTGGGTIDYRGFQWGTTSGVYTANWTQSGSYGAGVFSQNITSFSQGTLYYFRALAHNAAGISYGSELSFLTKPDAPSGLTATPGNQQVYLEWTKGAGAQLTVVTGKIGSYPTGYTDGTSQNTTGTNTTFSGLTNGDHWYFRAWSYTANGSLTQYSDLYASIDAIPLNVPSVATSAATSVEETSATLNGNITSTGGTNADYRGFQWGTTSGVYTANWTESGSFGTGIYSHSVPSGLTQGTTYYYRALAHNPAGIVYGSEVSFLTKPEAPASLTATAVSSSQINLGWSKGTGANRTIVIRKIGSAPANRTDGTQVYFNTGTSYNDTSLNPGTAYYYSAWSEMTQGPLQQWSDAYVSANDTTSAGLPTATTDNATSVEETTADLNGTLTYDGGEPCEYRFEYGLVSGGPYGFQTPWTGSKTTGQTFSASISGLSKGTIYYFVAEVKNSSGNYTAAEIHLLTKPDPPVEVSIPAVSGTSITLSWTKGEGANRTMVRRNTGTYPTDINDGVQVYFDTGTTVTDTGLTPLTTYYYKAWSEVTGSQQWSDGFSVIVATTGTGAPTAVGGTIFEVDKMALVAPYIALIGALLAFVSGGFFLGRRFVRARVYNKRRP